MLSDVKLYSGELIVVKVRTWHLHILSHGLQMILAVAENKVNLAKSLHSLHARGYTAMNN